MDQHDVGQKRRIVVGGIAVVVAVVLVIGVAVRIGSPTARPPRGVATAPANCRGSFDPYRYTARALRACGLRVIPLERVTPLPGGGKAYVYADGSRQLIPPARLKPLTASDEQLERYGLPPRPRDPTALTLWKAEMTNAHSVAAPPFIVADPYGHSGGIEAAVK